MLTLTLTPISTFRAPLLAPAMQQGVGAGAVSLRRKWAKARHRFELEVDLASRQEAEQLAGLLRYLQGDTPVWYDGADFGDIQNPILVGYGTGDQVDFFLPHDNVHRASLVVYGTIESGWTLVEETGLLTFDDAPLAEAELTALYQCRYKVCVEAVSDPLLNYERQFFGRYKLTLVLRELPQSA